MSNRSTVRYWDQQERTWLTRIFETPPLTPEGTRIHGCRIAREYEAQGQYTVWRVIHPYPLEPEDPGRIIKTLTQMWRSEFRSGDEVVFEYEAVG